MTTLLTKRRRGPCLDVSSDLRITLDQEHNQQRHALAYLEVASDWLRHDVPHYKVARLLFGLAEALL